MTSPRMKKRRRPAGFGPTQAADRLGIAVWQFEAAVRRELIPPADLCDRWSAALVEAAAKHLPEILAEVGEHSPIGANRAADRLGHRLGMAVDRADVEVLVERNLLSIADHYKTWLLYHVRDLDRLVDERAETLAGIIAERHAWHAASLHPRDARAQLGWWRDEFERVVAERSVQPGQSGRFARTDIENLAADEDLCDQVRADRLLGHDQACEYLGIRRADFNQLRLEGLITPKTTRWMQVGRYKHATVPLYRVGDLDVLREEPGLDWEVLHRQEGQPSLSRESTTDQKSTRAQIIRRLVTELGDRFGVEVWAYYNSIANQWEIDWEELEPGKPSALQVLEAITIDRFVHHCADIVLSTEAGAAIRWARDMVKPGVACLLDTETVDLGAAICEIAVIDAANGEALLNTLVNPGMSISQGAFRIHSISNADVVNAPTWPDVMPELLRITKSRKILAYNADYDRRVICSDCHRHDLNPGHLGDQGNWGCVMSRRSDWLRTSQWKPLGASHRALADCLSALDVLRSLTTPPPWR